MVPCRPLGRKDVTILFVEIELCINPKTYQLMIEVPETLHVRISRLGTFEFPAGLYVYTGSASRNFEARVNRHLSKTKKLHWHIDYLLSAPGVHVREVRRSEIPECVLNQRENGEIVVKGFGSSDCRSGCGSHLKRIDLQAPKNQS